MPDVKEVIKGLEKMLEDSKYNDSVNWNPWADTETLEDALALLKAQEPRLVTEDDFVNADKYGWLPAWCEERFSGLGDCHG